MAHDFIQTRDEIYRELRDSLSGKVTKLTNFTDRSFNFVWTQAFSEEIRQLQELALVSELAGFIDYTGGPVTEDDIEELGLEGDITAERVNELMLDDYLDEYVKIVGVSRDPGARSTGTVTFQTQSSSTTIPEGTTVTTSADSGGRREFNTTEVASTADGVTSVSDVPIQAAEIGEEFDVPAGDINRISNPPVGVTGVDNPESTTGGEDVETNNELRSRAKSAVGGASEGGTVEGIKAFIRNNVEAVQEGDVIVDEFFEGADGPGGDAPFVDVIVDGGLDSDVEDAIDFSRPAGIRHNLIRPQVVQIGSTINLVGSDIDTTDVNDTVEEFFLDLGIGDDLYSDQLIREIMLSDRDIINIDLLQTFVQSVSNEVYTYQTGTTDYRLDFTYEKENGTVSIEDDSGDTYTEGVDFDVIDQTGDGYPETVVWDTNNATPDDGERFAVAYDVTVPGQTKNGNVYDGDLVRDEIFSFNLGQQDTFTYNNSDDEYALSFVPFDSSISIQDQNSTTFREEVDWQIAPLNEFATEDTFTFDSTQAQYTLSSDIEIDDVAIADAGDNIYVRGTDYRTIDTDSDSFDDEISWDVDVGGAVADDGGTTTDETTAANNSTADDMTLLPSSPATGDAYYFGHSTQFSGFDLNISTAGSGTWDVVWEYYNGTSWVALSNVVDDTNDFRNGGRNSVEYTLPTDWSTTSVGGISGLYWVRGRLDTFTSISTQPLGQEAEIGRKPDDAVEFTVSYDTYADVIRWDQSGEDSDPPQDDDFTVTYDQALYKTNLEITETPGGLIRDASGDVYNQDTEYDVVDFDRDKENEAIFWETNPGTLNDDEEFYFSYITEGDIPFSDREKADPGNITITVE